MASQITGVSIVCSTVCSGADQRDQRNQQSSVLLAIVGESTSDRINGSIWWRRHGIYSNLWSDVWYYVNSSYAKPQLNLGHWWEITYP